MVIRVAAAIDAGAFEQSEESIEADLGTVSFKVWLPDHLCQNRLVLSSTQNVLIKPTLVLRIWM